MNFPIPGDKAPVKKLRVGAKKALIGEATDKVPVEVSEKDESADVPAPGVTERPNRPTNGHGSSLSRQLSVSGKAAGTTQNGLFSPRWGFRSNVISNSYMSCGDKQEKGSADAAWKFVKDSFPFSL